jgi:hypothetical protein
MTLRFSKMSFEGIAPKRRVSLTKRLFILIYFERINYYSISGGYGFSIQSTLYLTFNLYSYTFALAL